MRRSVSAWRLSSRQRFAVPVRSITGHFEGTVHQASQTWESGLQRLNWGCGPCIAPGWINADRKIGAGVDLACDIRDGLPLASNHFDYVVGIHALQDLSYPDLLPALGELHRVLKPGGVLRLGLPDLDKALQAYLWKDAGYFYVPDRDARSIGGKLI